MKKIASLVLSLLLVFSTVSNVAYAKKVFGDFVSYGNSSAMIHSKGERTLLTEISLDGSVKTFAFQNIILCAFQPRYFAFISDHEGAEECYIWPFQGPETMISLEDYTPIFFDEDAITLRKGDTYYEVDMEQTASTGKLVVNSID